MENKPANPENRVENKPANPEKHANLAGILAERLRAMYGAAYPKIRECRSGLLSHLSGLECSECVQRAVFELNRKSKREYTAETLPVSYRVLPKVKQRTELVRGLYRQHVVLADGGFFRAALRYCLLNLDSNVATRYEHPIPVLRLGERLHVPMFYSTKFEAFLDFVPVFDPDTDPVLQLRQNKYKLSRYRKMVNTCLSEHGVGYKLYAIKSKPCADRVVELSSLLCAGRPDDSHSQQDLRLLAAQLREAQSVIERLIRP